MTQAEIAQAQSNRTTPYEEGTERLIRPAVGYNFGCNRTTPYEEGTERICK